MRCSIIQDKLLRSQERLLGRRLEPNGVTATMQNIRLIELSFRKVSLQSQTTFKKMIGTYKKYLKMPPLVTQWFGFT